MLLLLLPVLVWITEYFWFELVLLSILEHAGVLVQV
jgi:hypothetical protein